MNAARLRSLSVLMLILGLSLSLTTHVARGWEAHRADSHAPIGVVGDHMHHIGEWMLSYRASFSRLSGALGVGQRIGVMYAPSDALTLMAMVPFRGLRPGFPSLMALYALHRGEDARGHLNLGLLAPSALQIGLTYVRQGDRTSWGLQGIGQFALDLRPPSWRLTAWGAGLASKGLSGSLRLLAQAGPKGVEMTLGFGLNLYRLRPPLEGHRLAVELLFPVYEGPEAKAGGLPQLILGWQYAP